MHSDELYHHGTKGQRWGVRNGPPYPLNRNGTVFISGSWRTSESGSPYQRSSLPSQITDKIDEYMHDQKQIIVGEAPGVDRQVQDYLNSRNYNNVVVFGVDSGARYVANPNWRVRLISSNAPQGSSEWLAAKDVAMSKEATEGLTVVLDNGGAGATRNNAARLMRDGKPVSVFRLSSDNANLDTFVNERDEIAMHSDELYHHGIKGQKWGVRRFQNEDGSLTPAGRRRLEKADQKWVKKNSERVYRETYRRSNQELSDYIDNTLNPRFEGLPRGRSYINAFNREMAQVMNRNVGDVRSPSGRVVQFVAKRGELGVHMALADEGFDMNTVRNGVWNNGRVAYRQDVLDRR